MKTVQDICDFLEAFAPTGLAEDWDNVGLLVGNRMSSVQKIMTCLTITPSSAREAIKAVANLIVAHHPLPFRPLKRLTTDTTVGKLLLDLIAANVAVYSPHTAFDSAASGINQQLAEGLELSDIAALSPISGVVDGLGAGRWGTCRSVVSLSQLAERLKKFLNIPRLQFVGNPTSHVQRVAVACGSAGQFLEPARRNRCDVLITGETNFHTCLEAEAVDVALLLTGHFASERFGVEKLAKILASQFSSLEVWASREERDPLDCC